MNHINCFKKKIWISFITLLRNIFLCFYLPHVFFFKDWWKCVHKWSGIPLCSCRKERGRDLLSTWRKMTLEELKRKIIPLEKRAYPNSTTILNLGTRCLRFYFVQWIWRLGRRIAQLCWLQISTCNVILSFVPSSMWWEIFQNKMKCIIFNRKINFNNNSGKRIYKSIFL